MMITVHGILFQTMNSGIPLRGGISAGALTVLKSENNTTVFGKGLINAYKLETQQDWSGCIVDDELIEAFRFMTKGKKNKNVKIEDMHHLIQYPAPMKSGEIKERWVVDWTKFVSPEADEEGKLPGIFIQAEGVVKAFSSHKKNVNDWRINSIIRNTLDFWSYAMDFEGEFGKVESKEDLIKQFDKMIKKNNA